jgi:hypothetical protein
MKGHGKDTDDAGNAERGKKMQTRASAAIFVYDWWRYIPRGLDNRRRGNLDYYFGGGCRLLFWCWFSFTYCGCHIMILSPLLWVTL